jgi:maltose/moltooligosaccharide transporter
MSAIYERLGATPEQLSLFWIAGPITGMIIQPLIGSMSDRTWGRLGRRRPYFLTGAILASIALVLMPNSPSLWAAASLLWILDASINIGMEPFRALVADITPPEQRGTAYAFQSFAIGVGSVLSFGIGGLLILPLIEKNFGALGKSFVAQIKPICPTSVHFLFYLGALVLLLSITWTIANTKEYPPNSPLEKAGIFDWLKETYSSIGEMPSEMKKLALVQFFTWFGFFCLFIYFSTTVARNVFHALPNTEAYNQGIAWASFCFLALNMVCFLSSALLGVLSNFFRKKDLHTLALCLGGLSLIGMAFAGSPLVMMLLMGILGIAWAATLSIPYALLSQHLPPSKMGIYMGTFNIFICLPELLCSLSSGKIVAFFGGNQASALAVGGCSMLLAALFIQRVKEDKVVKESYPALVKGNTSSPVEPVV